MFNESETEETIDFLSFVTFRLKGPGPLASLGYAYGPRVI